MLVKSILKMKNITLALLIIILLAGFSVTTVILQGNDYPVKMIESIVEQYKPNFESIHETLLVPYGVHYTACQQTETLQDVANATEQVGREVFEPLLQFADNSPLVQCSSEAVYLEGRFMGGPLNLYIPVSLDAEDVNTTSPEQLATTIVKRALQKIGMDEEWINLYLPIYVALGTGRMYKIPVAEEYYEPVHVPVEPSEKPQNPPNTTIKTLYDLYKEYGFLINGVYNPSAGGLGPGLAGAESFHAEAVVANTSSGENILGYYNADIYIIIANDAAAKCIGLGDPYKELDARAGDGVVTGIVSPILGPLLGIPEKSWGEVRVGDTTLKLYNPGRDTAPYSYMLSAKVATYIIEANQTTEVVYKYIYSNATYRYVYSIIIPPSEIADLDEALTQDALSGPALLPASLTYLHYSPRILSQGIPKNITIVNNNVLTEFINHDSPILAPSPIFLESLGRLNGSNLLAGILDYDIENVNVYTYLVGISVPAYSIVIDYNADFLAKAGRRELANELNKFNDIINMIFYNKSNIRIKFSEKCNKTFDKLNIDKTIFKYIFLNFIEQYQDTTTSGVGIYLGSGIYVEVTKGYAIYSRGAIIFEVQKLSSIVGYRQMGMFSDPLVGLGVLSLVPAILLVAWIMTGDTVEVLIATTRRWIAVAHARGASLASARKRLALAIGGIAVALASAGSVLSGALLAAAGNVDVAAYVNERLDLVALSVLVAVVVVFIVAWRRSRSLLRISPVEAVRPVMSFVRASLPKPGRFNTLALVLLALSLGIGLPRVNIDEIDFETFGAFGIVLAIVIFVSMMLSPFAPLLALSEASRFSTLAIARRRLSSAIVRLVARGRGGLDWLAESSGEKIRDLLLSGTRAGALSLGLTLGAAFSAAGLGIGYVEIIAGTPLGSPEKIGALQTLASMLDTMAVIGGVFTVLLVTVMVLSVFREMERNVVILRARGASPRQALLFVYASLAPFIVSVILAGIVTAAVFYLAVDSVTGIAFLSESAFSGGKPPHVPLTLGLFEALIVVGVLAAVWLVPLAVSYRAARARDIARLLREGM